MAQGGIGECALSVAGLNAHWRGIGPKSNTLLAAPLPILLLPDSFRINDRNAGLLNGFAKGASDPMKTPHSMLVYELQKQESIQPRRRSQPEFRSQVSERLTCGVTRL